MSEDVSKCTTVINPYEHICPEKYNYLNFTYLCSVNESEKQKGSVLRKENPLIYKSMNKTPFLQASFPLHKILWISSILLLC